MKKFLTLKYNIIQACNDSHRYRHSEPKRKNRPITQSSLIKNNNKTLHENTDDVGLLKDIRKKHKKTNSNIYRLSIPQLLVNETNTNQKQFSHTQTPEKGESIKYKGSTDEQSKKKQNKNNDTYVSQFNEQIDRTAISLLNSLKKRYLRSEQQSEEEYSRAIESQMEPSSNRFMPQQFDNKEYQEQQEHEFYDVYNDTYDDDQEQHMGETVKYTLKLSKDLYRQENGLQKTKNTVTMFTEFSEEGENQNVKDTKEIGNQSIEFRKIKYILEKGSTVKKFNTRQNPMNKMQKIKKRLEPLHGDKMMDMLYANDDIGELFPSNIRHKHNQSDLTAASLSSGNKNLPPSIKSIKKENRQSFSNKFETIDNIMHLLKSRYNSNLKLGR